MTSYEQLLQVLRDEGHRLTPQRLIVLRVVAEGRQHMGVDEVFREAQSAYPFMDLATVYRTLRLFKQVGLVTEVAIGDRLHYELTHPDDRHHHMVCRVCHGAFNLSPHYLEEFNSTLVNEFGFIPDLDHFTIAGVCVNCRPQSPEEVGVGSEEFTLDEGAT
ncbi:MAG: Fur family transcriptional regulator [Chloroflexota bacterium]|nr:Fur family transcriptional regulator [Chloroflexota bacterium]